MKTVVVVAQHPDLAAQISASLNPQHYRVLQRLSPEEAEPLLVHGFVEACMVDVESAAIQGLWAIEKLRQLAPACPMLVFTGEQPWEWEEEAYLRGVAYVLRKPVRPQLLNCLLERLIPAPLPSPVVAKAQPPEPAKSSDTAFFTVQTALQSLRFLRDFSAVLTHSLCAEGLLKQFLLLLREILGVNRAAIFLRQPGGPVPRLAGRDDRRLFRLACAIGLAPGVLEPLELSLDTGIGAHLFRLGRILRRHSPEVTADPQAQKEFDLLSVQVAVPIFDRETLIGVAVFDERVTGEALANPELELIFHLLEQLGLAIKNIWLHDQLASHHQMLTDILRELRNACIVVGPNLEVLHVNRAARRFFGGASRAGAEWQFRDLPPELGSKLYQVLQTGAAVGPFRYEPAGEGKAVYSVVIVPSRGPTGGPPTAALLTAEDLSQAEQLQRLEIEAANLRLLREIAEKLANEVGNAITPLHSHQQSLASNLTKKKIDLDDLQELQAAMATAVRRVKRAVDQIGFLAKEMPAAPGTVALGDLLKEAQQEVRQFERGDTLQADCDQVTAAVVVPGNRKALKQVLVELLLNGLQAAPKDVKPKITVRASGPVESQGRRYWQIDVQDNGPGFTPEAAQKAFEPFYTTRSLGLGLGLTVARKILEQHEGRLEILPPQPNQGATLRILLPEKSSPPAKS